MKKWIYFTKGNGEVSSILFNEKLKNNDSIKKFIGDKDAKNIKIVETAIPKPKWDADKKQYVSDEEKVTSALNKKRSDICLAYQQNVAGVNTNFASLLHVFMLQKQNELKPKSRDCLAWYLNLWGDCHSRVDNNFDFSQHGKIPYTYAEVLNEIRN